MSKVTTIKNQNKLRVYLEKIKNEPNTIVKKANVKDAEKKRNI